jgi:hypothetical protein
MAIRSQSEIAIRSQSEIAIRSQSEIAIRPQSQMAIRSQSQMAIPSLGCVWASSSSQFLIPCTQEVQECRALKYDIFTRSSTAHCMS